MRARQGLAARLEELFPGCRLISVRPLAAGVGDDDGATSKAVGYGKPARVRVQLADGTTRDMVWHTAASDVFGHDRRADRADEMLLSFDTFARIPGHVQPVDVGAVAEDGKLISLRGTGEFYLLTSWAPGTPYADDLHRIAVEGALRPLDEQRCAALARYLAALHAEKIEAPLRHRRSVRDLVGHGEGIFGMVDGYPEDTPAAPPERLQAIERRALEWRWRLRGRAARLRRIHGDFHPFNVIFDAGVDFSLVDASRGCAGDPADDVTAMAVNYVFFSVARPNAWRALGRLWRSFFNVYLEASGDDELLDVAAPYLAWRGLVVANPRFYPEVPAGARDQLLGWIEGVLDAPRLDLASPEAIFT